MFKILAFLTLLTISPSAFSGTYVGIGVASKAIMDIKNYNSNPEMIMVSHGRYAAVTLKNGFGDRLIGAGYARGFRRGNWRVTGHIGLVYGYKGVYNNDRENKKLLPLIMPAVHYTKFRVQPGIMVIGESAHFTIQFKL